MYMYGGHCTVSVLVAPLVPGAGGSPMASRRIAGRGADLAGGVGNQRVPVSRRFRARLTGRGSTLATIRRADPAVFRRVWESALIGSSRAWSTPVGRRFDPP